MNKFVQLHLLTSYPQPTSTAMTSAAPRLR